jgi:hypothetical protein
MPGLNKELARSERHLPQSYFTRTIWLVPLIPMFGLRPKPSSSWILTPGIVLSMRETSSLKVLILSLR